MFKASNASLTSIIGESTVVNGDILSKLSVRIDGRVSGNVTAGSSIVISSTGKIDGNVNCESGVVLVDGHLTGDVKADFIKIGPKGRVDGNIEVKSITIEKGAIINSKIAMAEELAKS